MCVYIRRGVSSGEHILQLNLVYYTVNYDYGNMIATTYRQFDNYKSCTHSSFMFTEFGIHSSDGKNEIFIRIDSG